MKQGWEYKKWNEVLTIINGKNQSAVEDTNGEFPIYGSGGIMGYANNWLCPENCVIIGRKGNINKPIFVKTKFWNVDTAFGLNANKEYLLPKYLFYFCLDYNFERHNKAVTIPSLTKADLLKIQIPLPPKPTQLSIVSELDKINELIRLKKEQLKDYDNLAQSIFYEMFGDPVENDKGWEVSTYSKCFNIGSGGTPSKSVPEYWDNGNIPWIGSNMCQNCIITETDGKFITQEGLNNSSTKYLEVGTVLVALVGATIGKVALLRTPTCTNQNVAFIKANESKDFVPEYVFYNLMGQYEEFMKIGKGDFKMANQAFIKSLPILSPPLPLQHLFAQRIEQIERQKSAVQKSITDLEALLASRMQHWFE